LIEYLGESINKAAAISSRPHLGKAKVDEKDVLFSLRKVMDGVTGMHDSAILPGACKCPLACGSRSQIPLFCVKK